MLKRYICSALTLLMLLSVMLGMVSCNNGNQGDENNGDGGGTTAATTEPVVVIDGLDLVKDSQPVAGIVFKLSGNVYIDEALDILQGTVGESCGVALKREYDEMHKRSDSATM
ncbi:MAG: hypothetical protein J6Q77_04075, partial [Clostridia bacterium]|nr:hypothetical protein [Clostridia bacterium]